MVAEEATQVDFIANDDDRETRSTDNLKAALAELFPRSPSVNLQHLKPLYITAHIEGFPISKVFVDCGATVNIMPISVMKTRRKAAGTTEQFNGYREASSTPHELAFDMFTTKQREYKLNIEKKG